MSSKINSKIHYNHFATQLECQEPSDPSKVVLRGPALEGPIISSQPSYLIVDCSLAGPGKIHIHCERLIMLRYLSILKGLHAFNVLFYVFFFKHLINIVCFLSSFYKILVENFENFSTYIYIEENYSFYKFSFITKLRNDKLFERCTFIFYKCGENFFAVF